MKKQLADQLARLIDEKGQAIAQTARDLGYTRQRLHQLKTADRTASPEAIEEAINKLGYEVESITVRKQDA